MSTEQLRRSERSYDRAKAALELPMTVLAVALGVMLLVPVAVEVSDAAEATLDLIGWMVWAAFLFEYLVLLWLAPDRRRMVRDHPLELILLMLPILRPLRALRMLRAFAGVAAGLGTVRAVLDRRGLQWFFVFVMVVIGLGACFTLAFERGAADAQITTIGEALWWAIVTATTVGYGDFAPITPGGRGVAVLLMMLGISVVSVVTGNIASFFVERDAESELGELDRKLTEVNAKLDRLLDKVGTGGVSQRSAT